MKPTPWGRIWQASKSIGKYVLGFGLLAYILYANWEPKIPADGSPGTPGLKNIFQKPVHYGWLSLASVLAVASLLLSLIRWYLLVRALDIPFKLYDAIRLGLVGFTFNTILPSSVGGDLKKGYELYHDHPERRTAALSTILVDRVVGLWAMILLVTAVGGFYWITGDPIVADNSELRKLLKIPFILIGTSTLAWTGMCLLPERFGDRIRAVLKRIPKLGKSLSDLWEAVWIYSRRPSAILQAVLLCFFSHTGWVLAYHCAALTFEVTENYPNDVATIGEHLIITPAGMALQAFVPTPGGVGGAEAAFGELYKILGRLPIVGVLMCFTVRLINYGIGLLGYLVYLRMKKTEMEVPENG